MIKYRRLSNVELESLKDEFIKFLVVQGIDAATWIRLKDDESERADRIIDAFSDFIWEGILEKVRYLESIDTAAIKMYKCDADMIYLTMITGVEGTEHDFKDQLAIKDAMRDHAEQFQLMRAQKAYSPSRADEIFKLIDREQAHVSKGEMFEMFVNAEQKG